MKISKHVHSCLLVEDHGTAALIDPGSYTLREGALRVEELEQLDALLFTHEHSDHLSLELAGRIMKKFPQAQILANKAVVDVLAGAGISGARGRSGFVEMANVPHERVLGTAPEHTLFHLFGKLTHPGDSLQLSESKSILALPIQAPWGSMVAALEKAVALKPRIVIPIHDWHWKDEAREHFYVTAGEYLKEHGIGFRGLRTGEIWDVEEV